MSESSKEVFPIDCKDIVLREFRLEDLDELYNLTLQPEITDFLPDWIGTKDQYKKWLEEIYIKANKEFLKAIPNIENEGLIFGIILKGTKEFIGWCFTALKDELPCPNREIGYAISKYHRNKGYTTQAVEGMIKFLFKKTNVEVLNALALTYNIPSNRVIQKCGFKYINEIKIDDRKFHYYRINKNELQSN